MEKQQTQLMTIENAKSIYHPIPPSHSKRDNRQYSALNNGSITFYATFVMKKE